MLPRRRSATLSLGRGLVVAVLTTFFIGAGLSAAEARKLALVVGNSDYATVPKLKNAAKDAADIAAALERLGFEVTLLTDVKAAELWTRVDAFGADAETAEASVFYYAGHAFQMNGSNYLVPVDAALSSREAIRTETWNLDGIIARLQDRRRQTLIFLDACRNDPVPASVRGSAAADGLARIQTGVGTFVAFATEPGGVTYDGAGDAANSPFTTALLKQIETPGLSISDMMIKVRNDVAEVTGGKQSPWDQSSLREQFYFQAATEKKQELTEADYELLAQLPEADRKQFMELLAASGFSEESLQAADDAITVASYNLEVAAESEVTLGAAPVGAAATPVEDVASIDPSLLPTVEGDQSLGGVTEAGTTVDPEAGTTEGPTEVATAEATTEGSTEVANTEGTTEATTEGTTEVATAEGTSEGTTEGSTEVANAEGTTTGTTEATTEGTAEVASTEGTTTGTTEATTEGTTEVANAEGITTGTTEATTEGTTEVASTESTTTGTTEATTEGTAEVASTEGITTGTTEAMAEGTTEVLSTEGTTETTAEGTTEVASTEGTNEATTEGTTEVASTEGSTFEVASAEGTGTTEVTTEGTTTSVASIPETTVIAALPTPDPTNPLGGDGAEEAEPIRLAALTWETRGILELNAVDTDRARVTGTALTPDNDADRELLAAIDPALLADQDLAVDTANLALATQSELRRLGCYRMAVDGEWGRGSRAALTSYFLARRQVPTSLEPTAELVAQLQRESQVVCAVQVARAKVVPGKTKAILPQKAKAEATGAKTKFKPKAGRTAKTQTETKKSIKKSLMGAGNF